MDIMQVLELESSFDSVETRRFDSEFLIDFITDRVRLLRVLSRSDIQAFRAMLEVSWLTNIMTVMSTF